MVQPVVGGDHSPLADMWPGVEIRHLVALVAIADAGTIGRAADRIGYTQSAVSQQIGSLERIVGIPLLDRPGGPRPTGLTDAGQALLRHARAALAELRHARDEVRAIADGGRGVLRLGTIQSTGTRIVPDLLREFSLRQDSFDVAVHERADSDALLEWVAAERLDVCFGVEPLRPGQWETQHLLDDPFVLLAPRDAPEACFDSVSIDHVATLPLIAAKNDVNFRIASAAMDRAATSPNFTFRSDDNWMIQRCVAVGLGYSVAPLLSVDPADPATATVPIDGPTPFRRIHLVWREGARLSQPYRLLIETAVDVCADLYDTWPDLDGRISGTENVADAIQETCPG